MRLVSVRLHPRVRKLLYTLSALAWLSGVSFYSMRRSFQIEGDFGAEAHPWQHFVLSLHGGVAFLMLMMIGAMALNHVPNTWRTKRSRSHGIAMALAVTLMAASAWGLYYLSDENLRAVVANVHLWLGLSLPLLIALHVYFGRKAKD